jgi:hypothetical protein
MCINAGYVILRLDRGIQKALKRLDSRLRTAGMTIQNTHKPLRKRKEKR